MSVVPVKIAHAVDERDEQKCVRCGLWIEGHGSRHHRQRRAVGGHTLQNLVLLCGSGTTGCHGWVHSNPAVSKLHGYIIPTWVKAVEDVPVLVHLPGVSRGEFRVWMLLGAEGSRSHISTMDALERLAGLTSLSAEAVADAVASLRTVGGGYDYVADAVAAGGTE